MQGRTPHEGHRQSEPTPPWRARLQASASYVHCRGRESSKEVRPRRTAFTPDRIRGDVGHRTSVRRAIEGGLRSRVCRAECQMGLTAVCLQTRQLAPPAPPENPLPFRGHDAEINTE